MRNLALPALLMLSCRLWSQALSGTIVGAVTDEAGAVVPKAKVILTNQGTHFVRIEETNANGQYVAYSIPTGAYSIAVEMQGFGRLVRDGIELTAADTVSIDFKLAVGNVQQTVEVSASAPLLQSQTAVVSQLITNQQIEEMPLNGRTFTSLLLLSPGAYTGSSGNLETSQYAIRGSTNYSVNGSSAQNNSYLIDGMVNRNLWLSTLIMVPTIDSIQEFRVMTSNYSAEYGAAAGAVTVVQTKGGTNQLHGSAYEFLRNDKLDANNFFNNRAGVPRQPFRRNEFGATAGGPVRKDKTFFFADYQGIRLLLPQTLVSTIPTLTQRAMLTTGDFSAQAATIFDPLSVTAGQRNAFPGKLIPASRLDPAAVKLAGMWPLPQNNAATRNFTFNPGIDQRTDQFDVRLDQNIGNSDRLFFKYSWDDTDYITPGLLPPAANAPAPTGPYLSANGTSSGTGTPLRNQSGTFNYVKVIGPNTINEVRLGVVRWNQHILPLSNPFNTAAQIGIPGININDKSGGLPSLTVSGLTVIGNGSTYPEQSQTTTFQYQDILTMIRGSHTVKFGAQYVRNRFNGFSAFPTSGSYDFNGQYTRQTGTTGAQTALADFALGVPDAVSRNVLVGTFGMRIWSLSGFADDSWRITNRLTWNFGLRYELYAPPFEVHDHWSNFNVITGKLLLAGSNGNSRRLRHFDYADFEPRMGLTYALTSDRRTVLRTGFGVSYVEAGKGGGQLYKNLPFYFSQVISTDQNGAPPLRLSDGLPVPTSPNLSNEAELSGGNPNAWDFNLKSTQVMQWSFGIQRELRPDLLLDVSYVGSRTNGLNFSYNYNQSYPGPGAQGPRRPLFPVNQQVTNVTYETNYGSAKFHSLQSRLQKRYSRGLTVSAAFTYAKYLSNSAHINGGGNGPPQDARCFRCEWGPMPEDRRVAVVINHTYELPFGVGRQFMNQGILAHVVGNWTVTGIWSALTGDHVTPTLSTAVSNSAGGGAERPNRVRDGNLPSDQRSIDHWFDPLAFVPQPQFTFGNSGRGILEGPGKFNVDMGVHRNFPIGERYKVSFRWELFNAFNRANFGGPAVGTGVGQSGQISSAAPARIMQLALKVIF